MKLLIAFGIGLQLASYLAFYAAWSIRNAPVPPDRNTRAFLMPDGSTQFTNALFKINEYDPGPPAYDGPKVIRKPSASRPSP